MSHETFTPVLNPEFEHVLTQKRIAFPVPKALWLYVYDEGARDTYHDALWNLVGDPTQNDGAADPEIANGEFTHLKHAFYSEEGELVIMRQVIPEEPRVEQPRDFMTREVSLETARVRRLYLLGRHATRHGSFGATYSREQYVFSEDPAHEYVAELGSVEGRFPSLEVNLPVRGALSHGSFSPDGSKPHALIGRAQDLVRRADQFNTYYQPYERDQLAELFVWESVAPSESKPAIMAA